MRLPCRILAIAASGLACAGAPAPELPACSASELRPLPDASCELDAEVVDYKRDTVLTLWSYLGAGSPRLPLVLEFDRRARVESVCVEPDASFGRGVRRQLDRAIRALRAMPPGPACLAGTRLELAEDFADASKGWRRKEGRRPEVEQLCTLGERRCLGAWREPVCALRNDGSRKTYADACQACRDPAVTGYDAGNCSELR
jgi:hypothetical protein